LATREQAGENYGDVDVDCGAITASFVLFTVYYHFLISKIFVISKSLDDLIFFLDFFKSNLKSNPKF